MNEGTNDQSEPDEAMSNVELLGVFGHFWAFLNPHGNFGSGEPCSPRQSSSHTQCGHAGVCLSSVLTLLVQDAGVRQTMWHKVLSVGFQHVQFCSRCNQIVRRVTPGTFFHLYMGHNQPFILNPFGLSISLAAGAADDVDEETVSRDSRRFEDPDALQDESQPCNINSQAIRQLYATHLKRQIQLADLDIEYKRRQMADLSVESEIKRRKLRKLNLEIKKLEREVTEEKVCSLIKTEEICQGLRDQVPVYNEVKANIEAKQQKVRKRKEDRGQADHFKVGDLVLKKNARQAMRKGDKLEASLVGPYKMLKLEEKTAHLVSERGTQSKVNIDHLTHYFQPEERIPAKIRKLIDPTPLAGSNESSHTSVTPPARQPTSCEAQGPPLSADILIRDVWAGRRRTTLWSRLGPYKLYMEDLLYLAPGKELESQIINAYLTMVGKKSGAVIIDSYAMTAVWQGKQRGLKRLALDRDVAAGAVCHEGHWTLIIMYLKEMRSLYHDPFGATQQQIERCKHVTRALVRQKCPAIGRWACATLAHPRQQDTTSCGVFVCKLAEQILLAQQIDYAVDQEGVAMLRMDMAKALLANTDDLSQLCRACGEESSGAEMDEWRSLEQLREHGNTDDHS
ncbi:hypothetical protein ABVT39_023108 [Epinephelus coioides]